MRKYQGTLGKRQWINGILEYERTHCKLESQYSMAKHLLVSERCLIFRNTPLRYNQRALEKRMNERIQQLANRCTRQAIWPGDPDAGDFDKEKFSQLIVQECAQVLWNIDNGELHDEYVEALKKHFGIK